MIFYFVQKEETLYAIARRYQTTVHAIVTANRLKDPNALSAGQALMIPRPGEQPSPPPGGIVHLVRSGETIFSLADQHGISPVAILRANQIAHPEFILPGQQVVIPEGNETSEEWPMLGRTGERSGAGPVMLRGVPATQWEFTPSEAGRAQPSAAVIRYGRVYAGLGDGNFYCLDRHDGRVKWRHSAGQAESLIQHGDQGIAAPVIRDGLAYLCEVDGWIAAVDAYSGRHIWRLSLKSPITATPTVYQDLLLCGVWDGDVYAIEFKTGAIAWKRRLGGAVKRPLAAGHGRLIVLTEDGSLWAMDSLTGDLCWTVPSELQTPVCATGRILVGGRAYDSETGQAVWTLDTQHTPVIQSEQAIYPEAVVSLDSGDIRRRFVWPQVGPSTTSPTSEDASDGSIPSTAPIDVAGDEYITHKMMSTASGSWFLAVQGTRLYAWDLVDGGLLWDQALPVAGHQPPAIASDQIAITLVDGGIRSYRIEPSSGSV